MRVPLFSGLLAVALMSGADPTQPSIAPDRGFKPQSTDPTSPDIIQFANSDWGKKYVAINPARSLLLTDCSPSSRWCGQPYFSFANIFSKAAMAMDMIPDDAARIWYRDAGSGTLPGFKDAVLPWKGDGLKDISFQPLAVVNRMDLARYDVDQRQWIGAEIRFVYGLIPRELTANGDLPMYANFTVILEFTVPPRSWGEFQSLALKWMAITTAPDANDVENYLPFLMAAIREGNLERTPIVRLRMNRNLTDAEWGLSQWEFRPQLAPKVNFFSAPLNDQIESRFRTAAPNSRLSKIYLSLWTPQIQLPGDGYNIPIAQNLLGPSETSYTDQILEGPPGMCSVDSGTRNIIAMQQCSFCHTGETGAKFTHISNRIPNTAAKAGTSSVLSDFLVGKTPGKLPSIAQIWTTSNDAFSSVFVRPATTGPDGKPCPVKLPPSQRLFNDLARRALFLSAVLAFPDENPGSASAIQLARTNFSH
jgi:hypothetical protein